MSTKANLSSSPIPYSFIPSESEQDNPNKLFLGGVGAETTEKQLEEFFSQFGKVKDVRIVTDRVTAACKGYGFVTFEDEENVDHLVDMKTIRMNGTKLRIRKAIRRNASQFEHLSSAKRWMVMPSNALGSQLPSSILTPPSTPPNINALSLHNLDQSGGSRFRRQLDMDSVPVLLTTTPRQRAQSSPPSGIFYQQEMETLPPVFLTGQNQVNNLYPPAQRYHYRSRSYSEPVTPEELHHYNQAYGSSQLSLQVTPQQPPPVALSPQQATPMLLQSASPTKIFNPAAVTLQPPNQFFHPCYQIPENMYCIPQQPVAGNFTPPFASISPQNISY